MARSLGRAPWRARRRARIARFRIARGLLRAWLRFAGFAAITTPWGVFVLRECARDRSLRRHELVHVAQIRRLGVAGFYGRYVGQWLRYGYRDMPLEREARAGERRTGRRPGA